MFICMCCDYMRYIVCVCVSVGMEATAHEWYRECECDCVLLCACVCARAHECGYTSLAFCFWDGPISNEIVNFVLSPTIASVRSSVRIEVRVRITMVFRGRVRVRISLYFGGYNGKIHPCLISPPDDTTLNWVLMPRRVYSKSMLNTEGNLLWCAC